jgi:malate synthase
MNVRTLTTTGATVEAPIRPGYERVLTPEALAFIEGLTRAFRPTLEKLLAERASRLSIAAPLEFLDETLPVRQGDWTIAPVPRDLMRRTVEITGPVDRKMVINALNSGADCFMADFEDSNAPTWSNNVEGQLNLMDAVRRTIGYADPASGKEYRLA